MKFVSHFADRPIRVARDGHKLTAQDAESDLLLGQWILHEAAGRLFLASFDTSTSTDDLSAVLAALEAAFAFYPQYASVHLESGGLTGDRLLQLGIAHNLNERDMQVDAELLWQCPCLWLNGPRKNPAPLQYVLTRDRRHPRRPPKPKDVVYRRTITWLKATLSFRAFDLEHDLNRFHHWMNDPAVSEIWDEAGDMGKHRAYLEDLISDPHMIPLIASIDDQPFAYFEIYWAKENRLAPFYDVDDYDRGWHVLVGEPAFRGRSYVTAWLPSLAHYMFLDEPRTQRIVGEPRSDHVKQIRNLEQCGYAKLKEFDFPHKRALLVLLLRERFFADRLWIPRAKLDEI